MESNGKRSLQVPTNPQIVHVALVVPIDPIDPRSGVFWRPKVLWRLASPAKLVSQWQVIPESPCVGKIIDHPPVITIFIAINEYKPFPVMGGKNGIVLPFVNSPKDVILRFSVHDPKPINPSWVNPCQLDAKIRNPIGSWEHPGRRVVSS